MECRTTRRVIVAIDGPAGAGKSTVARRLAERLGFTYIDTGAMYRAVAFWALRENIDTRDAYRMEQLAQAASIEFGSGGNVVRLNGDDVTEAIRSPEVASAASRTAAFAGVRRALVSKQREMARAASVVMEGRDIGSIVFPDADIKIYLDAGEGERVRRRLEEVSRNDHASAADQIAAQIRERDSRDRQRRESPLVQAPDAIYLDSTALTIEQVEEAILKIVRDRIANGKGLS